MPCSQSLPFAPVLSQINSVHTNPISLVFILISSSQLHQDFPSCLFPSGFPTKTRYIFHFPPHTCHTPCQSHPPQFDYPNIIWWSVPIIKLLIIHYSASSCHFLPLRSKHFPQQYQHTLQLWFCIFSSLNFYVAEGRKKILDCKAASIPPTSSALYIFINAILICLCDCQIFDLFHIFRGSI